MSLCFATYLCLEFSGGTELKEELHNVIMALLGGEEQGGGTCLDDRKGTDVHIMKKKLFLVGI